MAVQTLANMKMLLQLGKTNKPKKNLNLSNLLFSSHTKVLQWPNRYKKYTGYQMNVDFSLPKNKIKKSSCPSISPSFHFWSIKKKKKLVGFFSFWKTHNSSLVPVYRETVCLLIFVELFQIPPTALLFSSTSKTLKLQPQLYWHLHH